MKTCWQNLNGSVVTKVHHHLTFAEQALFHEGFGTKSHQRHCLYIGEASQLLSTPSILTIQLYDQQPTLHGDTPESLFC